MHLLTVLSHLIEYLYCKKGRPDHYCVSVVIITPVGEQLHLFVESLSLMSDVRKPKLVSRKSVNS